MPFNWTCPFCNMRQTVTNDSYSVIEQSFKQMGNLEGTIGIETFAITCSNEDCKKATVSVAIKKFDYIRQLGVFQPAKDGTILRKSLIPESAAKPQPDYIPLPIREDYTEACLIVDASPKAAATLIRRCLQGMIRDFCGISLHTLNAEIDALKKAVDEGTGPRGVSIESVEAIDHVRGIGNVGAHMERDISVIVDVDPDEAQLLIEVTELLLSEWYVAREARRQRLERLKVISDDKQAARKVTVPSQLN